MRRRRHKAQMQVAAAILLALATATTVVAINTTANYTANITDLLPFKITDYFSKTIEIWAITKLDLDENLRLWLRLDNGTALTNAPLFVNYSSGNLTQKLSSLTNGYGFVPLNLTPGNYSIKASYPGGNYTLPVFRSFDVEVLLNTPINETINVSTQTNQTEETNTAIVPLVNQTENETIEGSNQSINEPTPPTTFAILDSTLVLPTRITRNNVFEIHLNLTNSGNGDAINLNFTWTLPTGFEILSEEVCNSVSKNSFCVSKFIVTSSVNTTQGQSNGKVVVLYEEATS